MEPLPAHAEAFHPNLGFGICGDGFATSLNVFNYWNGTMLGAGAADSPAVAEVAFYDPDGRRAFQRRERLAPHGSLHLDLATALAAEGKAATYGTLLCRLIPEELPPAFAGRPLSTEFVVEVRSPSGARSFVHNVGCPVYGPNRETIASEQLFADRFSSIRCLALMNNYHGPRLPLLSHGRARVRITNRHGRSLTAWSERVPPRGTRLFAFADRFPDLAGFLDGSAGVVRLEMYNIVRKPFVLVAAAPEAGTLCVNHF